MFVEERTDLKGMVRGRMSYVCSGACQEGFLRPEQEMRRLRRDTAIALALATPLVLFAMVIPLLAPGFGWDFVMTPGGAMTPEYEFLMMYGGFLLAPPVQFAIGWRFS